MLFVMFTLLMLQLHSFSRAVLVFLTAPLASPAWRRAAAAASRSASSRCSA